MEEVGKKIKKEIPKEEIQEKTIKFEDLPKKTQKKILRGDFRKATRVNKSTLEKGTFEILELIKKNPGITRKKIIDSTQFLKKKVKRILNHSSVMLEKKTMNNEERYYYVGDKWL